MPLLNGSRAPRGRDTLLCLLGIAAFGTNCGDLSRVQTGPTELSDTGPASAPIAGGDVQRLHAAGDSQLARSAAERAEALGSSSGRLPLAPGLPGTEVEPEPVVPDDTTPEVPELTPTEELGEVTHGSLSSEFAARSGEGRDAVLHRGGSSLGMALTGMRVVGASGEELAWLPAQQVEGVADARGEVRFDATFEGAALLFQPERNALRWTLQLDALPASIREALAQAPDAVLEVEERLQLQPGHSVRVADEDGELRSLQAPTRFETPHGIGLGPDVSELPVFQIPAPFIEDAAGSRLDLPSVVVLENAQEVRYLNRIPAAWLSRATFPLRLDPPVLLGDSRPFVASLHLDRLPAGAGVIDVMLAMTAATQNAAPFDWTIRWGDGNTDSDRGAGARRFTHTYADSDACGGAVCQVETELCNDLGQCRTDTWPFPMIGRSEGTPCRFSCLPQQDELPARAFWLRTEGCGGCQAAMDELCGNPPPIHRACFDGTRPPAARAVVAALPPSNGKWEFGGVPGIAGANQACAAEMPGSSVCSGGQVQRAAAAGDLRSLRDAAGNPVTSLWNWDRGAGLENSCGQPAPNGQGLRGSDWGYNTGDIATGCYLTVDPDTGGITEHEGDPIGAGTGCAMAHSVACCAPRSVVGVLPATDGSWDFLGIPGLEGANAACSQISEGAEVCTRSEIANAAKDDALGRLRDANGELLQEIWIDDPAQGNEGRCINPNTKQLWGYNTGHIGEGSTTSYATFDRSSRVIRFAQGDARCEVSRPILCCK